MCLLVSNAKVQWTGLMTSLDAHMHPLDGNELLLQAESHFTWEMLAWDLSFNPTAHIPN